jgi:hypothetical protein
MIPGCFGDLDLYFGRHPLDRRRGALLLVEVVKENVEYPELANAVEKFLRSKSCGGQHIEHELSIIETLFKPWIDEDEGWDNVD